ncbi:hypothetical protein [Listeria costaricensis]|uniref:hypothetical protein n=1 Tax=Listeria costaricensis TaxID=2026604 RepID=UPI0013C45E40|nr:hypothetical protein [Listeria costaricensis]
MLPLLFAAEELDHWASFFRQVPLDIFFAALFENLQIDTRYISEEADQLLQTSAIVTHLESAWQQISPACILANSSFFPVKELERESEWLARAYQLLEHYGRTRDKEVAFQDYTAVCLLSADGRLLEVWFYLEFEDWMTAESGGPGMKIYFHYPEGSLFAYRYYF